MDATNTVRTDDDLAGLDVSTLLRFGLGEGSRMRTALFGDGAVSAAVTLGRAGVYPRAVAFLAEVVRSGGPAYAAGLPEPVPGREAADTVRAWLEAGTSVARTLEDEESLARWLSAVAEIMAVRGMATASDEERG